MERPTSRLPPSPPPPFPPFAGVSFRSFPPTPRPKGPPPRPPQPPAPSPQPPAASRQPPAASRQRLALCTCRSWSCRSTASRSSGVDAESETWGSSGRLGSLQLKVLFFCCFPGLEAAHPKESRKPLQTSPSPSGELQGAQEREGWNTYASLSHLPGPGYKR